MASIYSTQLANGVSFATGLLTIYTVPANHLVVITSIDTLQNYAAAGESSYVEIGAALLLYNTSSAAGLVQQQWIGKQVLTAGQTIAINKPGSGAYYAVTGYLLSTS